MATIKNITQLVSAGVLSLLSVQAFAAIPPWYVGVSGAVTKLSPDTENSAFRLEEDMSYGGGVFMGFDVTRLFNVELGYNYLGSAMLANQVGENKLNYSAVSLGAMMYVLGDSRDIERRDGFAGYVRLGFNAMQNTTDIPLEKADNIAVWAGAGIEWPFTDKISARGEIATFDGDAQALSVALVYRPRSDRSANARAPVRRPVPSQQPIEPSVAPSVAPQATNERSNEQLPEIVAIPKPKVSEQPQIIGDDCTAAIGSELRDASGCALFRGSLVGVDFASGTANLLQSSRQRLDELVANLKRYPNVRVEVAAHTESFNDPSRAKSIAGKRAYAVAKYLAQRGISVKRLAARAYGSSQPLASDQTVTGRGLNNRIEIKQLR